MQIRQSSILFRAGSTIRESSRLPPEKEYSDVSGILAFAAERGEAPFIVIADGIEDPHNLGALIRCAECARSSRNNTAAQKKRGTYAHCVENIGGSA